MAMTLHGTRYARQLGHGVTDFWRSAPRRERQQTLFTLSVVTIVATLILAGLLV